MFNLHGIFHTFFLYRVQIPVSQKLMLGKKKRHDTGFYLLLTFVSSFTKVYEYICNTHGGMWTWGSPSCPMTAAHSETHSIWFYSPNTQTCRQREAVFPSVTSSPLYPPPRSPALPHVVTLIIVFFHMFRTCHAKIHLSSIQLENLEPKSP